MLQRHNDDTKDDETISYVDPHDTETTDERDMILNTYGDTAGYVSSRNINIRLILMFAGYNICKVSNHALMFFRYRNRPHGVETNLYSFTKFPLKELIAQLSECKLDDNSSQESHLMALNIQGNLSKETVV